MASAVVHETEYLTDSHERRERLPAWQRPDRWLFALIARVESRYGELASAFLVAAIAEIVSILFASTMTDYFRARFTGLSANPFVHGPVDIPFPEHRLRILGPVVAWVLGLRGYAGAYLPIAFNVPLLMLLYVVVRRRTSRPPAIVFTLLMATTQLTMTSRTLIGYHDSMVFLCAAIAMVSPSALLSGLFFFLGLFGDPRIVLVMPMLFVWTLTQSDVERPMATASARAAVQAVLVLAFVVLSPMLLDLFEYRARTGQEIHRYLSGEFLREVRPSYLHLSAWFSFKAGWLLAFAAVWLTLARRPWLALSLAGNMLAIFAAGLLVYDFSRALVFCFPALVLGVIELHRSSRRTALTFLGTCYLVNLTTPFYQGMTKALWIQSYPLPADILLWCVGR